ncbi:MAG: 6-bladed beta-propeller [Muribaculaceae bacterium]|nr:6-bladed beta-propeller [Muribaculaceae bacterium]
MNKQIALSSVKSLLRALKVKVSLTVCTHCASRKASGSLLMASLLSACLLSCNGSQKNQSSQSDFDPSNFTTLNIENDEAFFDSALNDMPATEYIVLQESDSIMFKEIDKLVVKNNKYFVLDAWGSRTVVSFDQEGKPIAKYGRIGQGPGEYFRPMDLWVKDSIVYILDANQKKVMRFQEDGRFISETNSIPFFAEAFAVLPDNGFIFGISLDGESGPRLCVADSALNNLKYLLDAPEGFVGGMVTSNMFQETKQGITYYKAPLDTMYYLDNKGDITGGLVFDFGDKALPDNAKLDYMTAWENKELQGKYYLNNSPFIFSDEIFFSIDMDGRGTNAIYDKKNNKFGGKAFASENVPFLLSSINAVDDNNNLYGFTTLEYVEKFDKDYMPSDSIMRLLEDNPNLIIKYPFSQK